MTSSRIRQVYYSKAQVGYLEDMWEPYYNTAPVTPYFENDIFKRLYLEGDHKKSDYYGIVSYKFSSKHHRDCLHVDYGMKKDEYSHDVYAFEPNKQQFKNTTKANTFFDTYHPHLLEIGREIVKRLFNKEIHTIKADRIYYNHWIAKSEVFDGYCREMLLPAMDLMENDPIISDLCDMDAKYNNTVLSKHIQAFQIMSTERCMEVFGKPFYDHRTFVLERLPSIYFALKGHKVHHI